MLPSFGSVVINEGNPLDVTNAQNRPIFGRRDIGAAEYNCTTSEVDTKIACDSYTWLNGETYTANNSSAMYTTFFSSINGVCDTTYTLNLTIQSNTGTDTQTACDTYTWVDGNTYTSSNTIATYTLTNIAGCDSVVTLNLTLNNVNNVNVSTTQTEGVNLSANATGATYQWLDCDNTNTPITGETNQTFTATINGNYAVEISENGCTSTSDCIAVNNVGVSENVLTGIDLAQIYPNPTTNNVSIKNLDVNNTNYTVNIYNLIGELVLTEQIKNTTAQLNTTHLQNGVYLVEIQNQNSKQTLRLVKQ